MKILRWFRQESLSRQLLVSFGFSLATVGLSTLWINYHLINRDLEQQVKTRAESITQSLEFASEGLLEMNQSVALRRVVQNYATLPAMLEVAIVDPTGLVLAHSHQSGSNLRYQSLHPDLMKVMEQASQRGVPVSQETVVHGKPALVQILPFTSVLFGTSKQRGLAIAIVDLRQMQQEASDTFLTSTLTLLAGIVIIMLLMGLLIRQTVLQPLKALNGAVMVSKKTGNFTMPENMPANEIRFLATSFKNTLELVEAYDQLKAEITHRKQVENILRESEARERNKSQELETTLDELKRAQTRLIQSEKMSSLGQLVAGVAHEINNPINFIHGNILHADQYMKDLMDLLQTYEQHYPNPVLEVQEQVEDIDLPFLREDLPKLLGSMKVGADRIREIVQSLRTFSRLDEAEVKDVDIHEGLDSTLMILQNRLKAKSDHPGIHVVKQYGNLPRIECYAGQLNQVFMNILVNAIDALDDSLTKGKGTLASSDGQKVEPTITIRTESTSHDSILIHIADNGPGMPEEVQKRLFDPFFTTKPVGKGTGMGMSISYQIVTEKHHGSLHCHTEVGKGTEFTLEIPIKLSQA